ncbi:MAG TPA: uroporphyrinogen-III synthase [Sphingomicrobium sp.]|nr:uroporphyrinogen-III synthase [Sphingomicrobium sp.]
MTHVLVLRPEPGAGITADKARKLGMRPLVAPLFQIEAVEWQAPDAANFDGVLLTSANAIRCAGEQLSSYRGLKAYAVGEATAESARHAGFDIASTGESGVERLLASIEPDLKLLHLAGEDRHAAPAARQAITTVAVYRSIEITDPKLRPNPGDVAMIHSPRAGRRFAELVRDRTPIGVAAISEAAAAAAGAGWMKVEIAEKPNDEALLALAARLCKNA